MQSNTANQPSDTPSTQSLIQSLSEAVGKKNIYLKASKTEYYRQGFRSGKGDALAVVFPHTLVELWKVLQACVAANTCIIMQAANTGLTEGSTPSADGYDRDIVIINTLRLSKIIVLENAEQVISLSGSTLHTLEKMLKPYQRSPHSVIGSSCLGASIVGGVANNSGGALVKRGPAYTELSLYAYITGDGKLELKNDLGVDLGETPEEILANLENETFSAKAIQYPKGKLASDQEYDQRVRNVTADTPARYNADKRRLYGASGCAGKVAIFAVRLDTFPIPEKERVFYIGTNDPQELTRIRQHILTHFTHLPEVAEYIHRDIFNIAEEYGKDTFLMINLLGTDKLPGLFAIKGRISALLNKLSWLPTDLPDRIMQWGSRLWVQHLPKRMIEFRDNYEHHLVLKMSEGGIEEATQYFSDNALSDDKAISDYFICTDDEAKKALLHRFAAAGAAVRYETVHHKAVEDILALDIALQRNDTEWAEILPPEIEDQILHKLYYGHFMCHVFHQDYIVKKGVDVKALKQLMLELLEKKGAKYPAEHNVGHLYKAEEDLKNFYQTLDPTNTFNPGIGKTSKKRGCC